MAMILCPYRKVTLNAVFSCLINMLSDFRLNSTAIEKHQNFYMCRSITAIVYAHIMLMLQGPLNFTTLTMMAT